MKPHIVLPTVFVKTSSAMPNGQVGGGNYSSVIGAATDIPQYKGGIKLPKNSLKTLGGFGILAALYNIIQSKKKEAPNIQNDQIPIN